MYFEKKQKLLKTEHKCTFVYIINFTKKYYLFLGVFAALPPSFWYFYNFLSGVQKYVW